MILIKIGNFRKPACRLDFFIGDILGIIDAIFGIITFGLTFSSFKSNWTLKMFKRSCDSITSVNWFYLNKPFNPIYNTLYNMLGLIDNIVGVITFAHYSCELQSELTDIALRRMRTKLEKLEKKSKVEKNVNISKM